MSMKIYIPTAGRAGKTIVTREIPKDWEERTYVLVRKSEKESYTKALKDTKMNIVCVPKFDAKRGTSRLTQIRAWLLEEYCDVSKALLLDDDISFYRRFTPDDWHMTRATHKQISKLFSIIENKLSKYTHVYVSTKQGNNRAESIYRYNERGMRAMGYNVKKVRKANIEIDRTMFMSDFDITLQLLKRGHKSLHLYKYAQDQRHSNMDGGCSSYRTPERMKKSAYALQRFHPDVVRVHKRITKHAWKGFKGNSRYDVIIYWKKAYNKRSKK